MKPTWYEAGGVPMKNSVIARPIAIRDDVLFQVEACLVGAQALRRIPSSRRRARSRRDP
jgi:hypothetical protein